MRVILYLFSALSRRGGALQTSGPLLRLKTVSRLLVRHHGSRSPNFRFTCGCIMPVLPCSWTQSDYLTVLVPVPVPYSDNCKIALVRSMLSGKLRLNSYHWHWQFWLSASPKMHAFCSPREQSSMGDVNLKIPRSRGHLKEAIRCNFVRKWITDCTRAGAKHLPVWLLRLSWKLTAQPLQSFLVNILSVLFTVNWSQNECGYGHKKPISLAGTP